MQNSYDMRTSSHEIFGAILKRFKKKMASDIHKIHALVVVQFLQCASYFKINK